MPIRNIKFQNRSIYHIFNKSVEGKKIFNNQRYATFFLKIARYYRSREANIRFSNFRRLKEDIKKEKSKKISQPSTYKISILAYCLMPTHFHFLIMQKNDRGTQKFISDVMNSFTRYYNILNKRIGPLFLPRFKAVPVTRDDQLIHVSRYIHLNPYSGKLVSKKDNLRFYPYSSYPFYISSAADPLVENEKVMELFDFSKARYEKFVLDNAQHQQMLGAIKHTYTW